MKEAQCENARKNVCVNHNTNKKKLRLMQILESIIFLGTESLDNWRLLFQSSDRLNWAKL